MECIISLSKGENYSESLYKILDKLMEVLYFTGHSFRNPQIRQYSLLTQTVRNLVVNAYIMVLSISKQVSLATSFCLHNVIIQHSDFPSSPSNCRIIPCSIKQNQLRLRSQNCCCFILPQVVLGQSKSLPEGCHFEKRSARSQKSLPASEQ